MRWIFQAISNRLKALFVADVALEFESQLSERQAQRKADLLRQAAKFEQEGLDTVAADLRNRAVSITTERPLATVLPALEELRESTMLSGSMVNNNTTVINSPNRRPSRSPSNRKAIRTSRRK